MIIGTFGTPATATFAAHAGLIGYPVTLRQPPGNRLRKSTNACGTLWPKRPPGSLRYAPKVVAGSVHGAVVTKVFVATSKPRLTEPLACWVFSGNCASEA